MSVSPRYTRLFLKFMFPVLKNSLFCFKYSFFWRYLMDLKCWLRLIENQRWICCKKEICAFTLIRKKNNSQEGRRNGGHLKIGHFLSNLDLTHVDMNSPCYQWCPCQLPSCCLTMMFSNMCLKLQKRRHFWPKLRQKLHVTWPKLFSKQQREQIFPR